MLNKNLRTILYYVVSVSMVCLMIEFTKRIPDPRTSLSPQYYDVVTAKQSELNRPPSDDGNSDKEDVIPLRNRGRPKPKDDLDEQYNEIDPREKEKFREWKKKHKFKPSETGLYKKWRQEIKSKEKKERKNKSIKSVIERVKSVHNEIADEVNPSKHLVEKLSDAISEDEDEDDDDNDEKEDNDKEIDTDDLIDYPGGMTEYSEPGDNSCVDFEITDDLKQRQESVREACDKYEDEMGTQKLLFSRLR